MNGANVFVQIKIIQLVQKARHLIRLTLRSGDQPIPQPCKTDLRIGKILCIAAQKPRQNVGFRFFACLAGNKSGDIRREFGRIGGLAGAAADAEQGGGFVVRALTQLCNIQVQGGDQNIQLLAEQLLIRGDEVRTVQKAFRDGVFTEGFAGSLCRKCGNGEAKPVKAPAVDLRNPFSAAVTAHSGGRQAGGVAELLGRAVEQIHIFFQLLVKIHPISFLSRQH